MALFDFLRRSDEPKKQGRSGIRKLVRNYAGANQGRLFADFVASSFSADSDLKTSLPILRDRSRDLAKNNEYAKRFLNLVKTNVVGETGFTLQVRALMMIILWMFVAIRLLKMLSVAGAVWVHVRFPGACHGSIARDLSQKVWRVMARKYSSRKS